MGKQRFLAPKCLSTKSISRFTQPKSNQEPGWGQRGCFEFLAGLLQLWVSVQTSQGQYAGTEKEGAHVCSPWTSVSLMAKTIPSAAEQKKGSLEHPAALKFQCALVQLFSLRCMGLCPSLLGSSHIISWIIFTCSFYF